MTRSPDKHVNKSTTNLAGHVTMLLLEAVGQLAEMVILTGQEGVEADSDIPETAIWRKSQEHAY